MGAGSAAHEPFHDQVTYRKEIRLQLVIGSEPVVVIDLEKVGVPYVQALQTAVADPDYEISGGKECKGFVKVTTQA